MYQFLIIAYLFTFLLSEDNKDKRVTDSVLQLLQSDSNRLSAREDHLRTQLLRIVDLSKTKRSFILKRPKTIKTFINTNFDEKEDSDVENAAIKSCCFVSCLFGCCDRDEKQFCLKS